jgi:MinD superfamily P-loop ATPase
MQIAVASGKGGTGKTTVSTNLSVVASERFSRVAYVDCDVEEPNGHIFLKPVIQQTEIVRRPVPQVNLDLCTKCGKCGAICRFSAIVCIVDQVMTFPELCHACGGCHLVCAENAITEVPRDIGQLALGTAGSVRFVEGLLNVGEALSVPVIQAAKSRIPISDLVVIDAPPGTSCPVIESVRDADFLLLVTEPTPFGLHDLKLAVDMARALGLAMGLVVNRAGIGDREVYAYCTDNHLRILAEIPDDRRVAELYSRGEMITDHLSDLKVRFSNLLDEILDLTRGNQRPSRPRTDRVSPLPSGFLPES